MVEGVPQSPPHLPPGPERRALMRELKMRIGRDDFSDAEWGEIGAEAPGMWAELQAMLDDADRVQTAVVSESGWVTQREAARLLGVHVSLVPRMVRRGDLTPRHERPSLSRDQVLELAAARGAAAAERERRRTPSLSGPRPPDQDH